MQLSALDGESSCDGCKLSAKQFYFLNIVPLCWSTPAAITPAKVAAFMLENSRSSVCNAPVQPMQYFARDSGDDRHCC